MVHCAHSFARSLILAVFAATAALAQDDTSSLPAPLADTVLDYAGALDPTAEARIQRLIEGTLAQTGVEVRVVTIFDTAGQGGSATRLDAYARTLFNAWGLDDPERNDGILVLVATGPREARIALGAGYGAVYDARAARVLSLAVLPELRAGRTAGAIEAGLLLVRARLIAPFQSGQPVGVNDGFDPGPAMSGKFFAAAAFGAVVCLAILLLLRNRRKRKTCPHCGALTLTCSHEMIEQATGTSTGTGLEHRLCTSCGFTDRRTYTVRRP